MCIFVRISNHVHLLQDRRPTTTFSPPPPYAQRLTRGGGAEKLYPKVKIYNVTLIHQFLPSTYLVKLTTSTPRKINTRYTQVQS